MRVFLSRKKEAVIRQEAANQAIADLRGQSIQPIVREAIAHSIQYRSISWWRAAIDIAERSGNPVVSLAQMLTVQVDENADQEN